ncbi:hypothetical protein FACS1894162_4510 [Bacteroidia bacterium]|nr:hypothetical protein FACS1894162_4510 [Bacteroidia bacterium]
MLTFDGSYCWFGAPAVIYHKGVKEQTYFSWVTREGDIMVAAYDHATGEYTENTLREKWESDDHDNPSLFIRKDGRVVVFFSKHRTPGAMQRVISKEPEDIRSFGEALAWGTKVSYPNPFQVGKQLFLFYRGINWHPTLAISNDNGDTFETPKELISGGGARPYVRYCQGKDGAIHIAFTTGHPRDELQNKIYYFKFKNNKFYRANGKLIKSFAGSGINIDNHEAEIVYDGVSNGKGWIWDIAVDPQTQRPVLLYASFPDDVDHRYNYAYWDGKQWVNREMAQAGKWFPQTPEGEIEPEPNYSGGLTFDSNNPSIIYLSKQVNGVFEIFKYITSNRGETWYTQAITRNTPDDVVNVRPIVPRNHKPGDFDVLWMRGKYVHYYLDRNTEIWFR